MRTLGDQELEDAHQALKNAKGSDEPRIGLRIAANEYCKAARKFDRAVNDLMRKRLAPQKEAINDCFIKELACLEAAITIFEGVGDRQAARENLDRYIPAATKYEGYSREPVEVQSDYS